MGYQPHNGNPLFQESQSWPDHDNAVSGKEKLRGQVTSLPKVKKYSHFLPEQPGDINIAEQSNATQRYF
jgi:hypothetical protein